MRDGDVQQLIRGFRRHRPMFARCRGWLIFGIVVAADTAFFLLYPKPEPAVAMLTANAVAFAAWQWHHQRSEQSLEAYFTRLDIPNQRWLAFHERTIELKEKFDEATLADSLDQFYRYYVYAELDNLEYALTKYSEGAMRIEFASRAVNTFVSRCRSTVGFCELVAVAVKDCGYSEAFERLIGELCSKLSTGDKADACAHATRNRQFDPTQTVNEARHGRGLQRRTSAELTKV